MKYKYKKMFFVINLIDFDCYEFIKNKGENILIIILL